MLTRRKISPKEMLSLGWVTNPKPEGHFGRSYTHKDGWKISHCGHPTAIWPYLLEDPDGRIILTGAAGPLKRADYGVAWPTVAAAVDFVATEQDQRAGRTARAQATTKKEKR